MYQRDTRIHLMLPARQQRQHRQCLRAVCRLSQYASLHYHRGICTQHRTGTHLRHAPPGERFLLSEAQHKFPWRFSRQRGFLHIYRKSVKVDPELIQELAPTGR